MSTIIEQAEQLQADLTEALAGLVDLVTIDGVGVKPSTRAAVVILPPDITFATWNERDTTWKLAAVAGPPDRPLVAMGPLGQIIDRLEEAGFNLRSAIPTMFELSGSAQLPAYEITLNPA